MDYTSLGDFININGIQHLLKTTNVFRPLSKDIKVEKKNK